MMHPDSLFAPEVDVSGIRTEDDTPVDNFFSEKQQRLLTHPLYSGWSGPGEGRPFIAAANVGLFSSPKKPPLVPDVFLSLDVEIDPDIWAKNHRSYFFWEFGKGPEIVIEVVSNKEGGEASVKVAEYRAMRIPHYVIFDPQQMLSEDVLRCFALAGPFYRQMDDPWFEIAQLGLGLWVGAYEGYEATWLRWRDREGRLIPTGLERAEAERQKAEAERVRADAAEKRAELLAARLRQLGMSPDEL